MVGASVDARRDSFPILADEYVLALPERIAPLRHIRSTILLGGIGALRDAGHYDAYVKLLAPDARETILSSVVGMWLPVEVGHAHYEACDALGLAPESAVQLGRVIFARTKGTLLGTALRLATGVGVTPWTVFPHFQRFWLRAYDGGGLGVRRLGPKEAELDLVGFPLVRSRYYRYALRGLLGEVVELFCRKAYIKERLVKQPDTSITLQVQWV